MRQQPPDPAIAAMLVLTGIAIGLVMFVQFITQALR
jgi:hypothetical protein